jgi:glycosyltransferase involved in cell wall biosynthesis
MAGGRLSAAEMTPLVSINLPCYRQLDLARRAVDSIRAQSFANLEVTLLDDGASDEYRSYVESLGDARVHYRRNPERLGAMRNMFAAIGAGDRQYTMAFHEDDLLSADYIAAAVGILESHPTCAFVACELREFQAEPSADELGRPVSHPAYESYATGADLVRGIIRGVEPMFGSVVYRRAALEGAHPDHESFATLVDRPFLLSILERGWTAAVIREPLVWYRRHGDGDTRHLAMTTDHVLQLFRTYRAWLPKQWNKRDRALFFSYTGYWLFELYRLTPPENRPPVWRFLFRAWREGLYSPRARGRFGLRQIQRAAFNQTS